MSTPTPRTNKNAKPVRRMTVCCKRFARFSKGSRPASFPIISLSGKWLKDTGFQIGHVVDIACEKGRLTITIAKEQKYVEVQELLHREKIEIV